MHQLQKLCELSGDGEKLLKKNPTLPFLERHDCRTLILQDCFIGVDSNQKLFAKPTGLKHRSSMACKVDMSLAEE